MDKEVAERGLFGGNITVEFPRDWIDASDRQPVPDHQEAFLTPNGPFAAKLIFEITAPIDPLDRVHLEDDEPNFRAVNYYMDDLTGVTNDTWKKVEGPRRVCFQLSPMHQYAAYYLEAEIADQSSPRKGDFDDNTAGELPQPHSWFHLLLVRVPQHESEFVIQLIVKNGDLSALASSRIAKQVMTHMVKTLSFKNFKALIPTPPGNTEQEATMATEDAEEMDERGDCRHCGAVV